MSVTYTGPYKKGDIKKVVLAYSGGLDTSVILKWLQTTYGCEVVAFLRAGPSSSPWPRWQESSQRTSTSTTFARSS